MSDGENFLHWSFNNQPVLFKGIRITSVSTFFLVSTMTAVLCLTERFITLVLRKNGTTPFLSHRSRCVRALWRTSLYWVVTLLRLLYMLIIMSQNIGLLIVVTTSLAAGQFVIELLDDPPFALQDPCLTEPLLHPSHEHPVPLGPLAAARASVSARARSKPTEIFIHPQESNYARADVAAQEMGLCGDTELVQASAAVRGGAESAWEGGKGKEMARLVMGRSNSRVSAEERLFRIEDGQTDESDSD